MKSHALRGKLAEGVDSRNALVEAEPGPNAIASGSRLDVAMIVHLDIDKEIGGIGQQGREVERVNLLLRVRHRTAKSDNGHGIFQNVNTVALFLPTRNAHMPNFADRVGAIGVRAHVLEAFMLSG